MRNIAKKFKMTMSLIDIETIKPRYKCFFGEDVELCIKVIDEDARPVDLTDVNAKVYYTCDNFEPLRQDNDITINEPASKGTINILVNKKYLRLGVNTIRVALFDSDQEVLLQPCQVNCIETGIGDEHGDVIVNDDINVKDEFIRTNVRINGVDGRLKVIEGDIPEIKSELVDVNEQLDNKVNKGGVSVLDIDKNKGKLDQTYMSEEFLQQIVGNAPVSTIPSVGSITDEMFARPYAYGEFGKNLFNKNACEIGKYVGDNGQLGDNVDYCASHFIQVHPTKSYFLSITESWGFQFCYYDANKEFLSIDSTKGGVFTIPDNCYFVRFTFKPIDLNTIQFEEGTEQTQYEEFKVNLLAKSVHCNSLNDDVIDLISKSNYRITCKRNDNELVVGFKYNSNEDMRILFKPCGQNLLTQINNIYKFENKNIIPSLDFSKYGTIFQEATTDWIGPYIVRTSNNDGDMPNSWHFTSGWHGFNGDQTGSKTARNVSAKFYIDNVEIVDNNVKCGNEIKIIVVNNIQSTDTKKQDGSGRECLQETVTYTITPNNVNVDVEIKALENVKITTYYGLQTSNHSYDCEILYTDDETMKNWTNCENVKIDGGTKLNSECCEYKIRKNNDLLVAWIDNGYGLGKRKYVNEDKPIVWTADYSKSYMVLVNGNLDLITNEMLYWRGGYKFISLI